MKKRLFNLFVLFVLFGLTLVMTGCLHKVDNNDDEGEFKEVSGISIATPASKTVFEKGEDFTSDGLTINLDYTDGTHDNLPKERFVIDSSAYKKDTAGKYTISVAYSINQNMKATYEVTVREMVSLSITAKNNIILANGLYTWDCEEFGLKVAVNYSDGSKVEYEGDALAENFTLVETSIFGLISTDEGEQSFSICMKGNPSLNATFNYVVYDEYNLTPKAVKVVKGPTYNSIASIDDFNDDGLKVVILYNETGDLEFPCGFYSVEYPEEITVGEAEFKVVYYAGEEELTTTFKVNVVDISEYTLASIRLADDAQVRKVFYVGEDNVSVCSFGTKVIKTYKKDGAADIELATSYFEITDDGEVDTTEAGTKTYTIKVDESEIKLDLTVEVKNVTFADGVYIYTSLGGSQIILKVVGGKAYIYDAEAGEYATEASEVQFIQAMTDLETGAIGLQVVLYYDEETFTSVYVPYILNEDGSLTLDPDMAIIVKEENVVKVNAYTELLNGLVLYKVNNKITEEQLTFVKAYGKLCLDEEGKNVITADTVITGNEVYLVYEQEDYTGKPFLGTYCIEGEDAFVVTATSIESTDPETGTSGYSAEEVEGVWVISYMGFYMYYDAEAETLTFDMGFAQIVYNKKAQ